MGDLTLEYGLCDWQVWNTLKTTVGRAGCFDVIDGLRRSIAWARFCAHADSYASRTKLDTENALVTTAAGASTFSSLASSPTLNIAANPTASQALAKAGQAYIGSNTAAYQHPTPITVASAMQQVLNAGIPITNELKKTSADALGNIISSIFHSLVIARPEPMKSVFRLAFGFKWPF